MNTQNITVIKGNYGYDLEFTLYDANGNARDMSNYDATLKVWAAGDPDTLVVEGSCSWTNQSSGECEYTVQENDFDSRGTYLYEIEATATDIVESALSGRITVLESA